MVAKKEIGNRRCAGESCTNAQKLAGLSAAFTALPMLAGCDKSNDRVLVLRGWVEALLIFISLDQQGRVETQSVGDGDFVYSPSTTSCSKPI